MLQAKKKSLESVAAKWEPLDIILEQDEQSSSKPSLDSALNVTNTNPPHEAQAIVEGLSEDECNESSDCEDEICLPTIVTSFATQASK